MSVPRLPSGSSARWVDPTLGPGRGRTRSPVLHYVRAAGTNLDIMLPGTARGTRGFERYLRLLIATGGFPEPASAPERQGALAQLGKLRMEKSPRDVPQGAAGERPRIGVLLHDPMHLIPGRRQKSATSVIEGIERLGAQPMLIPPMADLLFTGPPEQRVAQLRAMVNELDGLVGPGGFDIHPRLYWKPNTHSVDTNYARDRFQADLLREAMAGKKLYYVGICRSHQLLNAIRGAPVIQDIEAEGYASHSHNQESNGQERAQLMRFELPDGTSADHFLRLGGELAERVGATRVATNSLHHQAVASAGRGLEPTAWSDDPHTGKTMVEGTRAWNATTVQYHPEARLDAPQDWSVFSTAQRAWAFCALRELERNGVKPSAAEVDAWVRARHPMREADHAWVLAELRTELALE